MCKTKKESSPAVVNNLLNVFVPCLAGTRSKRVAIRVFDRKSVLNDAFHSESAAKQNMEAFFSNLSATPGLPAAIAQDLQTFSFEVTFVRRDSHKDERESFGMMDFPVYLESTAGSSAFSAEEGAALLRAHRIPERTEVFTPIDNEGTDANADVNPYRAVEEFIPKDEVFGAGVPGTYRIAASQSQCRKIGIIKGNRVIAGVASFETRQNRLVAVLKHELGHMFGMAHVVGTLMEENYENAIGHPTFSIGQVIILYNTVTTLSVS
jgi:hypothetical protein